jgi:hypothetical protein
MWRSKAKAARKGGRVTYVRRPAMKKISTAAAKQSKDFREQELTIGLDLGDRWLRRKVDLRKSKSKST